MRASAGTGGERLSHMEWDIEPAHTQQMVKEATVVLKGSLVENKAAAKKHIFLVFLAFLFYSIP